MDERISEFIKSLKIQLEGLPEKEICEAVGYYEEYFTDAAEEGKDMDKILQDLDSPETIAGTIRTEISITRAQQSPGLKNFTNASRNALKSVKTPLAVFVLSITVFISFCMVAVLFASTIIAFAGAVIIAFGFIYEVIRIPSRFLMEILGTIGIGFFGSGFCLLLAIGFYLMGKQFIRISMQLVRSILLKSGKFTHVSEKQANGRKNKLKLVMSVSLVMISAGLVLTGISGLPVRYFTIFNSMKPSNLIMKTSEYDPGSFNKISIVTAHSAIRIITGASDRIVLTYEQPDWLDYEIGSTGSMLSFYEKSNGRLPLFSFLSLHESMTELTVALPEGYDPEIITLETQGGHIYISGLAANIRAKSFTNSIHLNTKGMKESPNVKANTWNGDIFVGGIKNNQRTNEGIEYYKNTNAVKTIELLSSTGAIYIDSE